MTYVVLGTGSREWTDEDAIVKMFRTVDAPPADVIYRHGAARGFDTLSARIAKEGFGWELDPCPADWDQYGKKAGPIRNAEMIAKLPKPDVCFGFPLVGSKGTYDCMAKAKAAGIRVEPWISERYIRGAVNEIMRLFPRS